MTTNNDNPFDDVPLAPDNFTDFTDAQFAKYREKGGSECPMCGSEELSGGFIEIEAGKAYQKILCARCGILWRDVYVLVAINKL